MKEYTSTDPRWPGKIYTDDYMTFPNLIAWEDAIASNSESKNPEDSARPMATYSKFLQVALKVIKKWEIAGLPENVTLDTFPGSATFMSFVIDSVAELYRSTNETDPKSQSES